MQWDTFITHVLKGPGVALNLSTSCMWNLSPASQTKPQFCLMRVISKAIAVLYGSTHRQYLFYFPSLEFLLCHFPSVEMKGQIAIWNPYIKVHNYSLFFLLLLSFGGKHPDWPERISKGISGVSLSECQRKADNDLSGLVKKQYFLEASGPFSSWSSDFSQACEQKNQEFCRSGLWCRLPCLLLSRKGSIS